MSLRARSRNIKDGVFKLLPFISHLSRAVFIYYMLSEGKLYEVEIVHLINPF